MQWENRDTNIVEQASIAKFSKLDDIGTPLRLFELFFDDALIDMIVGYTKLHDNREKSETSFQINNETFRLSLACYYLVSLLRFYTVKCIARQPRYFCTSNIVPRGVSSQ